MQPLVPVQFQRLDAQIGRALFRPVQNSVGAAEDSSKKDVKPSDEPSKKNGKPSKKVVTPSDEPSEKNGKPSKKDVTPSDEPSKKNGKPSETSCKNTGKSKTEKEKSSASKAVSSIKLPAPGLLSGKNVEVAEVIDPTQHLQPTSDRLERKREYLKRKDRQRSLHISGGCLANLNNICLQRSPSPTFACLLGKAEDGHKVDVKGLFIPAWECQIDVSTKAAVAAMEDTALQQLLETKQDDVVGCCVVRPESESSRPTLEDFRLAATFQQSIGEHFITALIGQSQQAAFWRVTDAGLEAATKESQHELDKSWLIEIQAEVHWTGPKSLYYFKCVSADAEINTDLYQAAREGASKFWKQPSKRAKSIASLQSRRSESLDGYDNGVSARFTHIAGELKVFSEFLIERMGDLAAGINNIADDFERVLNKLSQAKVSLENAGICKLPNNASEAGQLLADVLDLKQKAEQRKTKWIEAGDHSFNGHKYAKRRRTAGSTTSSKSTSTLESKESLSAADPSTMSAEDSWVHTQLIQNRVPLV